MIVIMENKMETTIQGLHKGYIVRIMKIDGKLLLRV